MIVTQTSDTFLCLVPIASSFGDKVSIKRTEESKEEIIPLSTIKYLATETNIYENVSYKRKGKDVHKLMWLEEKGKLNLYLEIITNTGSSGGNVTLYGPPTKTYVIRKADSTYLIEEKHFKEVITHLISDNINLVQKVEAKLYKYDNIEALIKEYNTSTKTN